MPGDRVRVRLSVWTKVLTPLNHWAALDGATGVITNTFCALEDRAHMYTVDFDKPIRLGGPSIIRRSFIALDLLPEGSDGP